MNHWHEYQTQPPLEPKAQVTCKLTIYMCVDPAL